MDAGVLMRSDYQPASDDPEEQLKQLQHALFDGTGADMRNLDILVLVACAVGRLKSSRNIDVEGLYTKLLIARCPTVLAARRPIADTEAAHFAAEFVDQYMTRLTNPPHGNAPFLRARAFNACRRVFRDSDVVTDHLIQAFELYGLG